MVHEELDAVGQGFVQTDVRHNVPGLVGRVVAAHLGSAAEGPRFDPAVLRAGEGHAQVIQLQNGGPGLLAELEGGCLVHQVVAALYGIIAVQFVRVAFAEISDAVDAALGHTGGVARGHAFGDHHHVEFGIFFHGGHGRAQPRAARSNDQHVTGGHWSRTRGRCQGFFEAAHVHRQRADGDAGRLQKFSAGNLLCHKGFLNWIDAASTVWGAKRRGPAWKRCRAP